MLGNITFWGSVHIENGPGCGGLRGAGGVLGVMVCLKWWCALSGGVLGAVVCSEWWCHGGAVSSVRVRYPPPPPHPPSLPSGPT